MPTPRRVRNDRLEYARKIALSFRDLVLMVAYYPDSDYRYGLNENHYVPLWTGRRAVLPINHLMDESAPHSSTPNLELLLRNISVVSEYWAKLVENTATTRLVIGS